jgi:hypothetical protein
MAQIILLGRIAIRRTALRNGNEFEVFTPIALIPLDSNWLTQVFKAIQQQARDVFFLMDEA